MGDTILLRRGTFANLPALQEGEPGWCTDTETLYIGGAEGSIAGAVRVGGFEIDALTYLPNTFTQATIAAALTAIGLTNKVTLLLRPGTWVISSNADWSAYINVTFKIVPGAVISHSTFTVNIPNRDLGGSIFQWLTGSGAVTFSGNVDKVYPEEFTVNATPGTTDMTTALQYAANTGKHVVLTKDVMHTTTITLSVAGTKVTGINRGIIVKSYGCNGFTIAASSVDISTLTMNSFTAGGVASPWTNIGINASAAGYPTIYLYENINNLVMGGWDKCIKFYAIWDSIITNINAVVNREFVRLSELSSRITITNNWTNSSATGGIRADVHLEYVAGNRPEGVLIQGNYFYGGDYGVYSPVGVNGGLTITDNDISAGISAIKLQTPNYTTIANNTSLLAQGANYVIDIPDENSLVDHKNTITGNHIWNNSTGGGIYIGQYSQNWVVTDNVIDTSAAGISIGPLAQDIVIDNNIFDVNAVAQTIYLAVYGKRISITNNMNVRIVSADMTLETDVVRFNNNFYQKVTTRSVVPTRGTWNLGDKIYKDNQHPATSILSSLGDILGWVCSSAGTFSTATDSTGDTTDTSTTITGLTDTSDFFIGEYVTISAGFPSATVPYMIIGKTATTLTFITAATSTQSNVTIATPDPVFSTFGQQGYRSGAATPNGSVTPNFIGEEYLDSTAGVWYKSKGAANTDWVALN